MGARHQDYQTKLRHSHLACFTYEGPIKNQNQMFPRGLRGGRRTKHVVKQERISF